MAELFYPQLKTGAVAQYPIRKVAVTRAVSNVLPGGGILLCPDDAASRTIWNFEYAGVSKEELSVLQNFFEICDGPLKPFTFLDPTGNLLSASSNFLDDAWQLSSAAKILGTSAGPLPNLAAFTLVNNGQTIQELEQTLDIPASYHYCCSMYVSSATSQPVTLFRRSPYAEETALFNAGPEWKRVWTAGNLQDQSTGLSIGLKLSPGQHLSIAAAQLEAQPSVSPYRNSSQTGGDIYPNAHWALEELKVRHLGPNSVNVSVSIEA
jgi:hypothetical protein